MASHGALPPSLARLEPRSEKSRSGSPEPLSSERDDTFIQLNQHIDVEKEITQFVEELDEYEGREELVFTSKTRKSPCAENVNNWGGDVIAPGSTDRDNNASSLF
ncbi:uncharacterized protein [Physcomitrium patens]|uniref:Uncharacterized protein n=1 Tax=Physcomitrium patens TaxID=3218 RepID=A0A2K1LAC5_PHYPA|nr:hypothetical protein PHYPA_001407 [Physcomitrium patens]